jgi:pyridoxamine 5'-phosphate oxidase
MASLGDRRREYLGKALTEADAAPDPFTQFSRWFEEAGELEADPTAMALATAGSDGRPSVRIVLLKGVDPRGFVFFTNYESRKASELEASGWASLLFFWRALDRQVRIDGRIERLAAVESDAYFATRPLESRWAVHAARQSQVLPSRAWLEAQYEKARTAFGQDVPRPASWGGYRVMPEEFEFWQGRPNRLHDRLRYRRAADGPSWHRERLAP